MQLKQLTKTNMINLTFVAKVIYHDNLSQVSPGRPLNDTVNCSHQCRPAFVMKNYDHTRCQQPVIIMPVLTPEIEHISGGYDEN